MAARDLADEDLGAQLSGRTVSPSDPDYDAIRAIHNGMIDKRPALIACCQNTADVADAIRFGRAHALEISVRGGGHNVAGTAVSDGGLMIDLAPMKAVLVDPVGQRAHCQPGVTWGEFNRETQLHGLGCTGGVVSSTGVAGLTLGGGIGWVMARYGLALDNLVSAEVVTANSEVIQVSETSHPDLFWALRGGGGNFGVVTRLEFQLHRFGPTLLGGPIIYPVDKAVEVLRFFREFAAGTSDDVVGTAALQYHPDGSGRPVAVILAGHCGEPVAAEAELAPLHAFGDPLDDDLGPISYCDINAMLDAGLPRGARNYWRSNFSRELSDELIDTLVSGFHNMPSEMSVLLIEHLHGAVTRVDPTATAFAHRSEGYNILTLGQWADSADDVANIAWTRDTHTAIENHADAGIYSNYMGSDEGESRVRAAYGVNYDRLRQVKKAYDPDNVFRLNQNIPPA
jgi:FAD/FMN-containing dehydrogenase